MNEHSCGSSLWLFLLLGSLSLWLPVAFLGVWWREQGLSPGYRKASAHNLGLEGSPLALLHMLVILASDRASDVVQLRLLLLHCFRDGLTMQP